MSPYVAIFGGSFNPPHIAHQMVCLYVLETQDVERVVVVPCFRHPFDKKLAPFADRLDMCRAAAAPFGDRVVVSPIEQDLGGDSSRTLLTVQALAKTMPGASFRLIVGSDLLPEREKWWRWEDLAALAPPLVVGRAGHPVPSEFAPMGGPAVLLPSISSTLVRSRIRSRESVSAYVPRSVAALIAEKGLYLEDAST
jgi:nicotinate-nucleotide adenylyltransferase